MGLSSSSWLALTLSAAIPGPDSCIRRYTPLAATVAVAATMVEMATMVAVTAVVETVVAVAAAAETMVRPTHRSPHLR